MELLYGFEIYRLFPLCYSQKVRYRKRIKALTSQLNEAKQETSIQLFELKDEITRLTEKNRELEGVFTGQPQFGDEPTDTYKCIQRIWRKDLKKLYYSQAK